MEICFETDVTGKHFQFIFIGSCAKMPTLPTLCYEKTRLFEDIGTFCGLANVLNCNLDDVCPGFHSTFSEMHKIWHNGINANFVFPHINSFLHYLQIPCFSKR